MRLIAERVLHSKGVTYVDKEIIAVNKKVINVPVFLHHVYCSVHNPTAQQVVTELAEVRSIAICTMVLQYIHTSEANGKCGYPQSTVMSEASVYTAHLL